MAFIFPGLPNELPINAIGIPLQPTDTISLPAAAAPAIYGVFDYQTGEPMLTTNTGPAKTSVTTISVKQDYLVSDYPVEQGSFASYDKVIVPFDIRLRFIAGGSSSDYRRS